MRKNQSPTLSNEIHSDPPDKHQISQEDIIRARYYNYYASLPNLQLFRAEKMMGLKSLGVSDQECKRLCKPKEIDREEMLEEVRQISLREHRELRRAGLLTPFTRKPRKAKQPISDGSWNLD